MSDRAQAAETWLSVEDAARLLGVSDNSIRNWIRSGALPYSEKNDKKQVLPSVLRQQKLLREKDLLNRGELIDADIEATDLAAAIASGAVVPSDDKIRRFSLEDAEALLGFKKGTWSPAPPPPPQPAPVLEAEPVERPSAIAVVARAPETLPVGSEYWSVLLEYVAGHQDPFKLPETFWDTRTCPEFIPPAGVFRFTYGAIAFDEERGCCTCIKRSEGWAGGKLVPENPQFAIQRKVIVKAGQDHPAHKLENLRWHQLKRDWEAAWYLRRRRLRAQGVDPMTVAYLPTPEPKDRRALLERYRDEHWTEADLPDWFWDSDEPPAFEPPTQACRFEYGKQAPDPEGSGTPGTWIRRTGIWQHPIGDRVFFEPAEEHFEWVPGAFAERDIPPAYEQETRRYDQHVQAWHREWERRRRRRLGLDD